MKSRARLIMISIALILSLSLSVLAGGHAVRAEAGSQPNAAAMADQHCGALSCLMSVPALQVSLATPAPIEHTGFQKSLPVASIALPKQDPPPRFAA